MALEGSTGSFGLDSLGMPWYALGGYLGTAHSVLT